MLATYSYYVLDVGPLSGALRRVTVEPVSLSQDALVFLSRCVNKHWTTYSLIVESEDNSAEDSERLGRELRILEELEQAGLAYRDERRATSGCIDWTITLPQRREDE